MYLSKLYSTVLLVFVLSQAIFSQASAEENFGSLQVFTLKDGEPASGQTIYIDDKSTLLKSDTFTVNNLNAGEHSLVFKDAANNKDYEYKFLIKSDLTTTVTIHFYSDNPLPFVNFEVPAVTITKNQQGVTTKGVYKGKVVDYDKNTPISGVRIYIKGVDTQGVSSKEGTFELQLPVGEQEISFIHPKYSTRVMRDINVIQEKPTVANIRLLPAAVKLKEFVVLAPHIEGSTAALLDERRKSKSVADVLGAEQMSKAGDSDAASALKRVTGLTLVGGKYVYIRGLGERYSTTLVNDGNMPSPEPMRRVVPLDMFPVDLLDSVIIQKAYSPDLPAEFGGGTIKLRTKSLPDNFTLKLSLSTGGTQGSTFTKGHTYSGGKRDWLGKDDGTRALPKLFKQADKEGRKVKPITLDDPNGYSDEELVAIGRSLPNKYETDGRFVSPDFGAKLILGNTFKRGKSEFGFNAAVLYDQSWEESERQRKSLQGADENLELFSNSVYNTTERKVKLSSFFNLGLKADDHSEIQFLHMFMRKTNDSTSIADTFNKDDGVEKLTELKWLERTLDVKQLNGHHAVHDHLEFDWLYTYSIAHMSEPDYRKYKYEFDDTLQTYRIKKRNDGMKRTWAELNDESHESKVSLSVPFGLYSEKDSKVTVGTSHLRKIRDYEILRYDFGNLNALSDEDVFLPPELIFAPDNIRPDGLVVADSGRATDTYDANQQVRGDFFAIDLALAPFLQVVSGARKESSNQEVNTFELYNPDNAASTAKLETTHYLPVYNLSLKLPKNMFIKAGYSQTLSRPDFRELSTAAFWDDENNYEVEGNENLRTTEITNYDIRFEYFLSVDEIFAFGVFRKDFIDPIESYVVIGSEEKHSYSNSKSAKNSGWEVEFRKNLNLLGLPDYYLSMNYARIKSEIKLSEEQLATFTNRDRPLQGQSPYVFNSQLDYDAYNRGFKYSIVYNIIGKRIHEVGTSGLPDIYEQPRLALDFVCSSSVSGMENLTWSFKAKNLLSHNEVFRQGGEEVQIRKKRRSYSLGISAGF